MKKIYIVMVIIMSLIMAACNDTWDKHYSEDEPTSVETEIFEIDAIDFLKSEAEYSEIYKLFEDNGIIDNIEYKDQQFTIIVYKNSLMNTANTDDWPYFAKTCICDIAFTPTKITNGLKILMWHNKYLTLSVERNADGSKEIFFEDAQVSRIVKVNDAYIYEVEELIYTPKSMFDIIEGLSDDYSVFRDMIMAWNEYVFDEKNSRPIGVNNAGQTVYDSLYVITNPLFDVFDFSQEYIDGTVLIPSNEVINNAIANAKTRLQAWNMTRPDSVLSDWIVKSAFFNRILMPEQLEASNESDISSAFSKVWRPSVQKVDTENVIMLSNGRAYYTKELKIPGHVLIYRIKHFYRYWDNCSPAEKEEYFKFDNLDASQAEVIEKVAPWVQKGAEGIWPEISNKNLFVPRIDFDRHYALDFTTLTLNDAGRVEVAMIPAGEYTLTMGFMQHDSKSGYSQYYVNIYINDEFINEIYLNSGTTYHYDRTGTGYPEGYTYGGNYDRDGGSVGKVTFKGADTDIQKMILRVESTRELIPDTVTKFDGHHWCLRPTNNHY